MLHIVNTFLTSISLGLFCLGLNFYIDLHLGYEFVSIAISLEVASFIIAVAMSRSISSSSINALALVTLCILIAASYLLFFVNYVNLLSYLIALLCIVIPVVLLGILIINNGNTLSIGFRVLSVFSGFCVGMLAAYVAMDKIGIWIIFMSSSAILILVIVLLENISILTKALTLFLFGGVLLFINNAGSGNQMVPWLLSGKPVAKVSLNLLTVSDKRGWSIDETIWGQSGRVDIVSSSRSRKSGHFVTVHDANIAIPFARKAYSTVSWWNEHYPLMILPFELKKPSRVLTIAAARGPDVDISQKLYGAETTSVYSDCVSLNDVTPCNRSSTNVKLDNALNTGKRYDLVSFSILNQIAVPYAGASASHEAIHTIEVFKKLYDSLDETGLLAINVRDEVLLYKTLNYVWNVLSDDYDEKIINFKKNIRVLMLNKFALHKDAYNYLVLVSRDGYATGDFQKISGLIKTVPVISVIYDAANEEPSYKYFPPYKFFKKLDKITISDAVSHLTKTSSWKYKKNISLSPSSTIKPSYFHLANGLHPFISALSAIILLPALYGLLFSHRSMRRWERVEEQDAPALSILLFQSFICVMAFTFFVYAMAEFSSASLGYFSRDTSMLIISALVISVTPYMLTNALDVTSQGIRGFWFYGAILVLSGITIFTITRNLEVLLDEAVLFFICILVAAISFCSGLVHYQAAALMRRFYPDVWFWFWVMASVAVVLGSIVAQYFLIEFNLISLVQTATGMFVFVAIFAWWFLNVMQRQ